LFQKYHKNGQLYYEGQYIEGKKEGLFNIWDKKGQLKSEHKYSHGVKR
jgi:antitoxin component YwqK of YwqJK toxin-antitoxin module